MAGDILKYVILIGIGYIFIMAFFSGNAVLKQTAPAPLDDVNNSTLAKQYNQTNQMTDLVASILPGMLILLGVWVIFKVFGNG